MPTPLRHVNGVTNVPSTYNLGMFGMFDPTKWILFYEPFNSYYDTAKLSTEGNWTVTETGSGTRALTDLHGGALLVTNAGADNDCNFFQKVGELWLPATGKKAFFKARFAVSDATQSDVVMGMQVTDTTPLAVTDGIWFRKDDGDANIDVIVQKDDTTGKSTTSAVTTLSDATMVTLGWYWDGVDSVEYFQNDVKLGTVASAATYLPNTELTVSFGIQNGEAAAKTLTVDYIFFAAER